MRASISAQARASIFGGRSPAAAGAARQRQRPASPRGRRRSGGEPTSAGAPQRSFSFSPAIRICGSTSGLSVRISRDRDAGLVGDRGQRVAVLDDVGAGAASRSRACFAPGRPARACECRAPSRRRRRRRDDATTTTMTAADQGDRREDPSATTGDALSLAERWLIGAPVIVYRSGRLRRSKHPRPRRAGARPRRPGRGRRRCSREAATRPAAGPGAKAGAEQLRPAALGADAGDAGRSRAASARAGGRCGSGSVAPTTAPIPLRPPTPAQPVGEPVDQRGEALVQRRLRGGQVLRGRRRRDCWCGRGRRRRRRPPRPRRPAAPARRRRAAGWR